MDEELQPNAKVEEARGYIPNVTSQNLMSNLQVHIQQQLAQVNVGKPLVSEGTAKELMDFLQQLAEKERSKKCGDPGTVVTSWDDSKWCTVCRQLAGLCEANMGA